MSFTRLKDGSLLAPIQGHKRVAAPDGYEPLKGSRNVFVPILPPCQKREYRTVKTNCCTSDRIYCHLFNKDVGRLTCLNCSTVVPP